MGTDSKVVKFHMGEMNRFGIPDTIRLHNCPHCKSGDTVIRSVTLKFNAKNFGDIAMEIFCNSCKTLETLYYRKQCSNMLDFCDILTGKMNLNVEPIIEKVMYSEKCHNIIEKMSATEGNL